MFYSVGIFRTSSPGDNISSDPERTAPRRWEEEPGYIEVLQQRAGDLNIKRLLLVKENQVSQVKVAQLCSTLCNHIIHGILRARILEYSGWAFPSLGDLPKPGIKPRSPTLQADSLPAEPQGKPLLKDLKEVKENQISQVKEFSPFLCMGRFKSLGSFLSYAAQLSGASTLCFSHPELPWGSHKECLQSCWL